MGRETTHSGTQSDPPRRPAAETLAARQWGVFSIWQRPAGLSPSGIRSRLARGKLFRVYRGVYSFVHPKLLRIEARYMAAVLACGPQAALSYRAAAAHWGLRASDGRVIDVSIPRGSARRRSGIRVHRTRGLEATSWHGIPITTVAQTIVDLAEVLDRRGTERLIERAVILGLFDLRPLQRRMNGRKGAPVLTSVLAEYRGDTTTKSDSEELYLRIIRERTDLPDPYLNRYVEGHERDAVWPHARVIVEVDARSTHDSPRAWERDRIRDQAATAKGWTVVRFTKRQLEEEPDYVAAYTSSIVNASSPTSRNFV